MQFHELTIPTSEPFFIRNGRLWLGTYPRIFLCELDGPRRRQVWIGISRG